MLQRIVVILIALVMASLMSMPLGNAIAAESGTGLDAVVVGSNSFSPGTTAQVQIVVQNNNTVGKLDAGAAQAGLSQYYGSAVGLTATLVKGNAPINIKADKMLLGTLTAGAATPPIPFAIEVDDGAQLGVYQAQLVLTYKTLVSASAESSGAINLQWSGLKGEVKDLNLEIKGESPLFEITSFQSVLRPGVRNELKVIFKNAGNETARGATVQVSANAPLLVTDNSSFLGTLEPGQSAVATFGVRVAGDAILKDYALDAFVTYAGASGDEQTSKKLAVPVVVSSTASRFAVTRGQFLSGVAGAGVFAVVLLIWNFVRGAMRKKAA